VGTILKVTPHISEGDTVQLKIEQEDSSPGAKLTDSADISTNKRSIKTTILIEDGGVIVLGGLMSDTVTTSEDRVPGLGAIPILGNLFKSRSSSRQKKNLMVFIRPRILRDDVQTESLSEAKYNSMRAEEKALDKGKIPLLPGQTQPLIPAPPAPPESRPTGPSTPTNPAGAAPLFVPPSSAPSAPPTDGAAPYGSPGTPGAIVQPVTRATPIPPTTQTGPTP
jgi:general secretion pathway protein D